MSEKVHEKGILVEIPGFQKCFGKVSVQIRGDISEASHARIY